MARVLIFSLVFPPDGVSTAQLMGELAEDLASHGHQVSVITTQPHYNRDPAAEEVQPLRPWRSGFLLESSFREIRVLHTVMPSGRAGRLRRLRGWVSFHLLGLVTALRYVPAPDVVIVPSPLLTAGFVAWVITRIRGGSYIYNVQELYPDLAVQMGRLRNPALLALLRRLERFVYDRAGAVTTISAHISERVASRCASARRVHTIPNFVDTTQLQPLPRNNAFSREWNLDHRFVVSYAGNMGHAQGLETVLEAAELCSDDRIAFALIGSGVLDARVKEVVRVRGLRNVILIPHQSYVRIPEIYAASDVCLVPLLGNVSGSALPSKVFRIMSCGRPVLALCDPESELAELIRDAAAGVVVPAGRADLLIEAAARIADDPMAGARMGRSGRAFAKRFYSRDVVTRQYVDLVDALAASRGAHARAADAPAEPRQATTR